MTARLFPSRAIDLGAGGIVQPTLVEDRVLAAHVMKHALGLRTIRTHGSGYAKAAKAWNAERFTDTDPPVVDEAGRDAVWQALGAADVPCPLPEARGKKGEAETLECYACPNPRVCAPTLEPLVDRYLLLAEDVLRSVEGGVRLSWPEVNKYLFGFHQTATPIESLTTLVVYRNLPRGPVVRATRVRDALRVELTVDRGRPRFRTMYRLPGPPLARLSAALDVGGPDLLSDGITVARLFAEGCGISVPERAPS